MRRSRNSRRRWRDGDCAVTSWHLKSEKGVSPFVSLSGLLEGVHVVDERDLSPEGAVAPSAGYGYIRNDYMPDGLPNERRFRITLSDPGRAVEFAAKLTLATANGARSEKSPFF